MSDKLPEWPPREVEIQSQQEPYRTNAVLLHVMQERDAALARMEALVEYAQHKPGCRIDAVGLDCGKCTCGLDELLAACERRSGG